MSFKAVKFFFLAGSASCTFAASASAQTAPPAQAPTDTASNTESNTGIADIIVTAERKESKIQSTPLAINAVSGDDLQKRQITGLESLTYSVPNMTFSRQTQASGIYIRGVGLSTIDVGSSPRVAVYTDDVYNARSGAALASLYDIERIEALAGPQGTLYGRNATAGAVNIITRDPGSNINGYGTLTVGNYGLIQTEGAIGGPLVGGLSARIAFQTQDRGGYGTNISTGEKNVDNAHVWAVRGTLKYTTGSDLSIVIKGDYRKEDDNASGFRYVQTYPGKFNLVPLVGGVHPSSARDYAGQGPKGKIESAGLSGEVKLGIGAVDLTYIAGYRYIRSDYLNNVDLSTANLIPLSSFEKSKSYTQELRLSGDIGRLDWIIGAYYFHEDLQTDYSAQLPALAVAPTLVTTDPRALVIGARHGGDQKTDAYAFFGQATLHITDRLGLDVGLRYSHEKNKLNEFLSYDFRLTPPGFNPLGPVNTASVPIFVALTQPPLVETKVDPKVTLHYQINDGIYSYLTYSRGFKSGGFSIGTVGAPFKPEELTDIEGGIKADLLDRRLRVNLSAFYYKYTNLQSTRANGLFIVTENAGRAKLYGAEAQIIASPTPELRLGLNAAYLHARFESYNTQDPLGVTPVIPGDPGGRSDLAGFRLPNAPTWKGSATLAYTIHTGMGDFTPGIDATWTSKVYFTEFNYELATQRPHAEVDLSLRFNSPDESWRVVAYVKNLTNNDYLLSEVTGPPFTNALLGSLAPPRTFGLAITKQF